MYFKANFINLKNALRDYRVLLFLFFSSISFFLLTFFLNDQHIAMPLMLKIDTVNAVFFLFFLILNSLLFGLVVGLIYYKLVIFKTFNKGMTFGSFAAFIGFLGGACATCYAGILPSLLIFLGISFSLASLPLNGLEIMIFSSILLLVSIYYLSKNQEICKIK
ncbi:MAG: hypothetical protein ACMXX6_00445 [Candidatus Woesearchaeota archaeon]